MREAIILVGGFGTRLRSIVPDIPKPMAMICGIPFLHFLIDYLISNGFSRIILSMHYKSEYIINYFNDKSLSCELIFSLETYPLGTGGAIKHSLNFALSDNIYVFNGDSFADINFKQVDLMWNKNKKSILLTKYILNEGRFGYINMTDNNVNKFIPLGFHGFCNINLGIYVINKNIFKNYHSNQFSFEKDFLSINLNAKKFQNFTHDGFFIDIGVPDDYKLAQDVLKKYIVK